MTKHNFAEGLAKAAFENSEDLYSILDALPMNIVFCGPDLNIKYLNTSSIELLNKNQKLLPVPVTEVLEASADIFLNKTNNHQSILANPHQQLPLNSNINFGKEVVKLSMIPIYSGDEFRGALISWSIITDKLKSDNELHTANSIVKSLSKSQAMIEFTPDGTVVYANDNFLNVLGYKLEEIKGRHHSIFCDPSFSSSSSYRDFWARLNRGEIDSGQHKRISKSGQDVWIQATYNPIFDSNGKVVKVVKFATDINRQKHEALNLIKSLSDAERKLTIAAQDLTATASQLSSNSAKTTTQSESASASAEQVSQGVRNVATNTEEMTASIKEISRSTATAAQMSRESQVKARETNNIIQKLGSSSSEIGTVVKVISSIAQQTNLLALNATIEAARAGDAGKGFAVVANEVKELAKQTAKATEEISSKIGAIQKDSEVAVSAMGDIAKAIEQLNNISLSISTAIEEQMANTNEVTRIVSESSLAVKDVAVSIKEVSMMSQQSSSGASLTLDAAKNLSILATELSGLVKRVETSF